MITPGSFGTKRASPNSATSPMTPTATVVHSQLPDVGDGVHEHRERVARRLLDADDLRQLADRDVQAEPDDEALKHRPREEAGDEAHPGETAGDVDHAYHERQRGSQRDVLRRARARRRDEGDRRSGQRRHRRAGTDEEVARAAQHQIADDRERHHVETVLDRHARDPGVGQRLRDHERPDGQPGHHVDGQPSSVVAAKPHGEQPHRPDDRTAGAERETHPDRMTGSPATCRRGCGDRPSTLRSHGEGCGQVEEAREAGQGQEASPRRAGPAEGGRDADGRGPRRARVGAAGGARRVGGLRRASGPGRDPGGAEHDARARAGADPPWAHDRLAVHVLPRWRGDHGVGPLADAEHGFACAVLR